MLFGSLIGSVFGASVPGSIYMSQRFDFKRPVYMDEPLVARVEVVEVTHVPRHTARCSTTITSQVTGQLVLSGEAMVMLPPMPT
jgi:acyl dehydratase